ncbi:hypothetical protein ACP4OV_012167 [Aristida adscensionis]
MAEVSATAGDRAPPPPAAQCIDMYLGSDSGSDSDRDHPLQEPEFVLHAVEDRHRQPPAAPDLLPMHQLGLAIDNLERVRTRRRVKWMLLPQILLGSLTLVFACFMIYYAERPDEQPDPHFIWLIVPCALAVVFSLLSLVLSYLGVYVYDYCPGLDHCCCM